MKKIIHIPKRASGSRSDRLGDDTLYYSSGISDQARAVSGIFLDNPPKLSRAHASLVWTYNRSTDRYMLMHVQGSHVVSHSMGRNYPYRATCEVSRDDMNAIGFSVTSLMATVPRIATMTLGQVESETAVDVQPTKPAGVAANLLRHRLQAALVSGQRLVVEVEPPSDAWREDGVLECNELRVLLSAIDNIPVALRRYATFAFCVDENFQPVLDGVRLVFCRRGSNLPAQDGDIKLTWQAALMPPEVGTELDSVIKACPLPGACEPLLPWQEVAAAYQTAVKSPAQLTGEEWNQWLKLGHRLDEVRPGGWAEFKRYADTMPAAVRQQLVAAVRQRSVEWGLNGLDASLYRLMAYDSRTALALQRLAMDAYLDSGKYDYLFADGMPAELAARLDVKHLRQMGLRGEAAIDKWIAIYERYERFDAQVASEFATMLLPAARGLRSLGDIVKMMRKYPFIPAEAYTPPREIREIPALEGLRPEQRRVVDGWLGDAVGQHRFGSVDKVAMAMERGRDNSIEARALERVSAAQLIALLRAEPDKPAKCEQLCQAAKRAGDQMEAVVADAVNEVLFGQRGLWNDDHLLAVDNWDKLAAYRQTCPEVFAQLEQRLDVLLADLPDKRVEQMAADVERLYGVVDDDADDDADDEMQEPADKHTPLEINTLVEKFVKTAMKRDKQKGNELKKRLGLGSNSRPVIIGSVAGLVVGILLASLVAWLLPGKTVDQVTEVPVPLPPQVKLLTTDDNLMTTLASYSIEGASVDFGSLNINIDSTLLCSDTTLLAINKLSLNAKMLPIDVVVGELPNGLAVDDSIQTISKDHSLLQLLVDRPCRVIAVKNDKGLDIRLSHDTGIDSITGALPASYYFSVVNDIHTQLIQQQKEELISKIPF